MVIRYVVELNESEKEQLRQLTRGGQVGVRQLKRAQILLAADQREKEATMVRTLGVSESTIYRTKRRYVEQGLEAALTELTANCDRSKLFYLFHYLHRFLLWIFICACRFS